MNTRRATHTALLAMLLAGSAAAQSGAAIDGAGFPDPEEKPQSTEQPRDDMGREEGAVAPQERTSEIAAPAAEPEKPRKRRWWRRDGPLTPEERMDRMERESQRQERHRERRQERTQPDSGGEPMGPTTTTPGENDTRR